MRERQHFPHMKRMQWCENGGLYAFERVKSIVSDTTTIWMLKMISIPFWRWDLGYFKTDSVGDLKRLDVVHFNVSRFFEISLSL